MAELNEHKEEIAEGDFGGLLDHIYGYKKTRDYALVCWSWIFLDPYLLNPYIV